MIKIIIYLSPKMNFLIFRVLLQVGFFLLQVGNCTEELVQMLKTSSEYVNSMTVTLIEGFQWGQCVEGKEVLTCECKYKLLWVDSVISSVLYFVRHSIPHAAQFDIGTLTSSFLYRSIWNLYRIFITNIISKIRFISVLFSEKKLF